MTFTDPRSHFLRRALTANGIFSGASGLVFLLAAKPLAAFLGLTKPAILSAVGLSLLLYALGLIRNGRRKKIVLAEATLAVILDFAWVAGSGIVILAKWLSPSGNWAVALVADIVLLFGVLQSIGIKRLRREVVH